MPAPIIPFERIRSGIIVLRGQRVMLSTDLAPLYGVAAKVLMQAVKRNLSRFPKDFMFRLDWSEVEQLEGRSSSRSQLVTLNQGTNVKHLPYAFTEQGVAMLASVLRSKRAVEVNIAIVRAFVQLRQWLISNKDLAKRLEKLENRVELKFETLNGQLRVAFEAIQELMEPAPSPPRKRIGFRVQSTGNDGSARRSNSGS
jgi:hypothetical protein